MFSWCAVLLLSVLPFKAKFISERISSALLGAFLYSYSMFSIFTLITTLYFPFPRVGFCKNYFEIILGLQKYCKAGTVSSHRPPTQPSLMAASCVTTVPLQKLRN